MPLLRKGILIPVKGVDWSQPATFIDDRAGFPQNMRFLKNEICKRPGKTLYEDAAIAGGQIMGFGVLELSTLKYLLRVSKTTLQKYNTSTLVWDTISATAFSGGDEDFFSFANVAESKFLVLTNGVDKIRKWTGSGNNTALGGNPPLAKYCTYLSPYLLLAYLTEGGSIYPWKVAWCDTDAPETWAGGNAGSALISNEPSAIQNIMKLNEYVALYKEESLWLGRKVETSDIFIFDCMKTGVGLGSPRALVDFEGQHAFMGVNDFYVWNGIREESIGGPIRDQVFSTIDRGKIKRCFAIHIKNLWEVWFFVITSGQTCPTTVWKYNYRTGFWYYDTCSNLTAAIVWKKIATESWDDDVGTWDAAVDTWDDGTSIIDWEESVFGNSSGNAMRLDYSTPNDLGIAVSAMFETKDYTADSLEFLKRWLQLDVWARGSVGAKLYVDYSTDYGDNWTNIPYNSSQAYITLSATTELFRMYFDVLGDHIRFRFRNAESGEFFYLRNFYPYYLGSAEVKA